ncbi:MAG: hypothetical protein K5756_10410 [Clostridiales bacterium]|nr:hypothetical protein [Clostridiales bacterium]
MKTAKKFVAVLLSAIFIIGMLPCSVFADSIPEELICEYYFGNSETYKYCGALSVGENTSFDVKENTAYFFIFVPEQTGVYCFDGNINGITGDTNDDRCSAEEFEDRLTLYTKGRENYADYSYLTQGKTYFVLVDFFEGVSISYEGTVKDVNPTIPLVDLVRNWDTSVVDGGFEFGLALDVEMTIKFSNNKTVYGWGFYFGQNEYTENNVTWKHLGFEKTFRYNIINIEDMISSIDVKNRVDFVRYFDDKIEFKNPVTVVINFSDGTSTEVTIEDYDYYYEFPGINGRYYNIYLDIDDEGELAAWVAGHAFGSIDYTMKRVGFFKDLAYYILCRSSVRVFYTELMKSANFKTKVQLLLDSFREIGDIRITYLKSLFKR